MKTTLILFLLSAAAACADPFAQRLAHDLMDDGDYAGATLEYRRLALAADQAPARAGWYWAAGYAYGQAAAWSEAERMLDRAEDAYPGLGPAATLLRGRSAYARGRYDEAAYFFESAARSAGDEGAVRRYAARQLAATHVQREQPAAARTALVDSGSAEDAGRSALQDLEEGRDRSPALGGWLGVVPGLGYAYAGEYANATRSLILNSLFIWGLVSTAEEEQWGAFAVISFFEITWYTGSIYGGVDASHRFNQRRRARAIEAITAGAVMTPDYEALPAVRLKISF
jgi:tetratricopeptide (TPR) repeat protein